MSTINVRLNADLEAKARKLRGDGVVLSELVRQAIQQAHDQRKPKGPVNRLKVLKAIRAEYPADLDDLPARYNLADRHQMRAAILERMLEKERRRK